MKRGKNICNVLKNVRQKIADVNHIAYESTPCDYQGECRGTCPACESEVRYIEEQLYLRRMAGKVVTVAGIAIGAVSLTSCTEKSGTAVSANNSANSHVEKTESDDVLKGEARLPDSVIRLSAVPDTTVRKRAESDTDKVELPVAGKVSAASSTTEDVSETVYDLADKMPTYPGGNAAMVKYINENLQIPPVYAEGAVQGRVIVSFIVEPDGSVSHAQVVRSLDPPIDEEALRVVSSMTKWNPGKMNGKVVRVRMNVPVTIKVE